MKTKNFKVQMYEFDVTFTQIESHDEKEVEKFKSMARKHGLPKEQLEDLADKVSYAYDGGYTLRDMAFKNIWVIIFPCTSEEVRRVVVNHEKRHVEDRILEHCNVKDIEASAFLAGFLSRYIF